MDLSIRKIGPTLVVSFPERVDLEGESSITFKEKLKALVGEPGLHVVMDLANVGFVDSQGLGALISGLKTVRQAQGTFTLANLSEPVASVLRITRLVRVFDVASTVEAAVASAAGRSAGVAAGA